jgi:hypothetical protein
VHTEPPLSVAAAQALVDLEDRLLEVERRMSGSPYEVLAVPASGDEEAVRKALAAGLEALEEGPEHVDVPPHLRRRLETARGRLQEAAASLGDPRTRVTLDLDIGLAVSEGRTEAQREALRRELAARRERATDDERLALSRAQAYLEAGTEKLGTGDTKGARSMLRMARLFDPYDLEILELCAAAHGVVASAESMAMLRGVVLPKKEPEPPPPPPVLPPMARRPSVQGPTVWPAVRLAGVMLLVMVLTASVSAASVLVLPVPDVRSLVADGAADEGSAQEAAAVAQDESGGALPEWVRLLTRARDAAEADDPAQAHALAAQSYELQATEQALEVMAVSACEMQDPASARASFVKLVGTRARQRVAQLCSRDHIDLRQGVEAATASDLLKQAREASEAGDEARTCKLASQSQALKHSAEALQIMVSCACKGGDAERAKRLADSLSDAEREPIRSQCSKQGIDIE